jgi:hypothetical protein
MCANVTRFFSMSEEWSGPQQARRRGGCLKDDMIATFGWLAALAEARVSQK